MTILLEPNAFSDPALEVSDSDSDSDSGSESGSNECEEMSSEVRGRGRSESTGMRWRVILTHNHLVKNIRQRDIFTLPLLGYLHKEVSWGAVFHDLWFFHRFYLHLCPS
ncbi:hypothetical protein BJ165DRAFT_1596355 [Panaeolus papilionaceus]|nr:hypothetical protein BJ165DRAFT_1596355 [Panaeolus papilionaceus]